MRAHADVEALLDRRARAGLPLWRQALLYLDPFAFFKDASRGARHEQERALSYNRAMRWLLLPYLRRWLMIGAASFAGIAPTEALAAQASFFIVPAAALAVGSCIAVAVALCTVVAYFMLRER